jgi:hypothetical protein
MRTLLLMHRWGYAPSVATLADELIGGGVTPRDILSSVGASDSLRLINGFVCVQGSEHLVRASRERVAADAHLSPRMRTIAEDFARDLARVCPFVESVALTGSLASGGYQQGDDIDFDLFVRRGTKYSSFLIATLVGLRYAWRYRHLEINPHHKTPFLPKIICINVVWPEDQTQPFVRTDEGLAFELLRSQPLLGAESFGRVLRENLWLQELFPQLYRRVWVDRAPRESGAISRFLAALARRPAILRGLEGGSRRLAWVLYRLVQDHRGKDPEARERMAFLRRVKYPYEVFQD